MINEVVFNEGVINEGVKSLSAVLFSAGLTRFISLTKAHSSDGADHQPTSSPVLRQDPGISYSRSGYVSGQIVPPKIKP